MLAPIASPTPALAEAPDGDRLQRLRRLWATVALHHPSVGGDTGFWDRAVARHLPEIEQASSPDELANAVDTLLSVLEDLGTGVLPSHSRPAIEQRLVEDRQPLWRRTDDDILVIELNDYVDLGWDFSAPGRLADAVASIPDSRGVVLDLRRFRISNDLGPGVLGYFLDSAGLTAALAPPDLEAPGRRRLLHDGLEGDGTFSAGVFSTHFVHDPPPRLSGDADRPVPTVFIVDAHADVPPLALAMQRAGLAALVLEGSLMTGHAVTRTVDLGDGVRAAVRISEPIFDGHAWEPMPDVRIPFDRDPDVARAKARELVRSWSQTEPPKPLAETPHPADGVDAAAEGLPTRGERIVAAYRIWTYAEHFFAYPHLLDRPWETTLGDLLPRFADASTRLDYERAVAAMARRLQDGHAVVEGPALQELVGEAAAPVLVRQIEGRPTIVRVREEAEPPSGARPGDVILEIDGRPVRERVETLTGLFSASNEWTHAHYVASRLLRGREGKDVQVTVERAGGQRDRYTLPRSTELLRLSQRSGPVVEMLDGNVAYIDLDRLAYDDVADAFGKVAGADALVLDLRGYPNGTLWSIAPRLGLPPDRPIAIFRQPLLETPIQIWGRQRRLVREVHETVASPGDVDVFTGPVVVLLDERTQSQSEYTAMAIRAASGALFVGGETAGANGNITRFALPGGVKMRFTGMAARWPDGTQLQRIGIRPDIEVEPTLEGIRDGRDEVLTAAIDHLARQ